MHHRCKALTIHKVINQYALRRISLRLNTPPSYLKSTLLFQLPGFGLEIRIRFRVPVRDSLVDHPLMIVHANWRLGGHAPQIIKNHQSIRPGQALEEIRNRIVSRSRLRIPAILAIIVLNVPLQVAYSQAIRGKFVNNSVDLQQPFGPYSSVAVDGFGR